MERREFIRACSTVASTASAASLAALPYTVAANAAPKSYTRALLVDNLGAPFKAAALKAKRNYVFTYPFATTPCFLLDLGEATKTQVALKSEDGQAYQWPGGVGPKRSIVAFSAICSHQLAYPTKEISFIRFRGKDERNAQSGAKSLNKFSDVIHCCAEHSQYDPAQGAKVVAGPAPQPLAAILLEHDAKTDTLAATGTLGGEVFNRFFAKYEFKLAMDTGGKPKQATGDKAVLAELDSYCRQQVQC
jgi:arsenite oxidase small subunit